VENDIVDGATILSATDYKNRGTNLDELGYVLLTLFTHMTGNIMFQKHCQYFYYVFRKPFVHPIENIIRRGYLDQRINDVKKTKHNIKLHD
jgi:hypothetical protein